MDNNSNPKEHNTGNPNNAARGLSRRELLVGIMATVGAATTVGCVEKFDKSVSKTAQSQGSTAPGKRFYSVNEFELISVLAGLIIPDTETPGALTVGTPDMMDVLHAEWASQESKEKHHLAVLETQQALDKLANQNFLTAPVKRQLSALKQLDELAFSGNKAWGYRSIKSLIARFYYFSEVGASQELRYELVPGRWEACIPFEDVGRTWAV